MSPQTVLVTGGAGFIGSHLVDELLGRGHRVVAVDNLANGRRENLARATGQADFRFVEGDILAPATWRGAVPPLDAVFHLACLGVRHSLHSPFDNHRVNAEGTLRVLDLAREVGAKRFLYISTSEIYGLVDTFPITEAARPAPITVYGASKLAGEHYALAYRARYGLPVTIARLFNNYGPRAHHEGDAGELIPRSIVRILYGKPPMVFGDGRITRDFFYVKDAVRALATLLESPGLEGATLNVGAGRELTIREVLETLLGMMGRRDLGIEYLPGRPADVPRLWVDARRFHELTRFQPAYTLEAGLKETISYYEALMAQRDLIADVVARNWDVS